MRSKLRTDVSGWRWLTELVLALALLAALAVWVGPAAAGESNFRGFITEGIGDVLLFNACEGKVQSKRTTRLLDKTNNEVLGASVYEIRQMMLDRTRPLYAEFRGDAAGVVVTARQLQRVIGHVESCPLAPTDVGSATKLQASGEDPAWRFILNADGARLYLEGAKQPVRFPYSAFKVPASVDKTYIYDAWSSQDGGSIRVQIEEQMCSDGRSETATGAKVSVRYGSRSFEGCAARF